MPCEGPPPSSAMLALLGEAGNAGVDDCEVDDLMAPSAIATFWAPASLPSGGAGAHSGGGGGDGRQQPGRLANVEL